MTDLSDTDRYGAAGTAEDLPDPPHNPVTGEIMPEPVREAGYARDGGLIPAAAESAGQFLDLLEDGRFSADAVAKFAALAREMRETAQVTGNKQKGKVVITLDLECEDTTFKIASDVKVTPPKQKRPRSTLWTDERDRFTRFPPGQTQMFGLRQVGDSGPIRRV